MLVPYIGELMQRLFSIFRYAFVNAIDKCAACNFPLMARSFYLFPCQHKFHSDCLIEEVIQNFRKDSVHLGKYRYRQVGHERSTGESEEVIKQDIKVEYVAHNWFRFWFVKLWV